LKDSLEGLILYSADNSKFFDKSLSWALSD